MSKSEGALLSTPIQTIAEIPRRYAAITPDAVAVSFEGRETSYRVLEELSNQVANGLMAGGVRPGSRIAILDKNSDIFFQVLLGAAKARAVLVPINARLAPPEIVFAVNDAKTEILFVGESFEKLTTEIQDQLETVYQIIVLDSRYLKWRDAHPTTEASLPVSPDDVCLQLYTSGTTGYPKGVQLSHANFPLHALDDWKAWSSDDVMLLAMPLFHIAGVGTGVFGLVAGLKTIVLREFVPSVALETIQRERATVTFLVPAMLLAMLAERNVEKIDLSSLRQILYGASPIPLELLRKSLRVFRHTGFFQVYGLTETTGVITVLDAADHSSNNRDILRSCGRPVEGIELMVIDASGKPLPAREVGEVVCRSSQNMKGYWNRAEDTARTLRNGWLHTGDAGFLDENGYLYIHDRLKDMIVSGGENVYPAEIESALYGHADIADVAVIGVPDDRWGEAVKALVVLKPDRTADPAGILHFARGRLAGFKIPKSIEFVHELPRNPSGKILKRLLRERYWEGYERMVN
ncbi:fatty acid--CoA ligase [Bradyrhizobium sp. 61]|uniref:fatty acid--CoA ligase n=1 Tax=unclassified Bradyrhizobium TaxID=2631580 RepID=UPI001FF86B54|nr:MULTISPECIES: fatty acid--CoA ligase [unclassified Bradyrhizobium]MCK1273992.1 fatty acid--CoA ligase [Bradyrhizobium sp. 61]MCK1695258.1 fatty acid--CoA ligase [Bradyrhizobium sp. 144]